jgi:glycosyltransferase involved in cell wall biosynthesis
VVSKREAELVTQAVGNHIEPVVIPNFIDLHTYEDVREIPQPQTLIFTGAFTFDPNYEAMLWFLNDVYDKVTDQAPEAHLTITGNHANRPLPSREHLSLAGFVQDVRPLVARSWCSIVPIHTGGGTRLKILEAMALGTPVVTTTKGMEGLDLCPGEHVLVADDPNAFAEAILALFADPALRQRLAQNARQLVQEKYNWAVVMPRFLAIIEGIPTG